MSWKTIVVGYERSHASNRALERAAEVASSKGARLVVTSIARPLPSGAAAHGLGPFDPADSPEEHRDELEHARELLANSGVEAEFELGVGDPADAILELAERVGADLVIVGTHERGLLDRLLQGSVSQAVTQQAHCDVLVVR